MTDEELTQSQLETALKAWRDALDWVGKLTIRNAKLELLLIDLLRAGEHDGPCINYAGQDPDGYNKYDSCWAHSEAGKARAQAARDFLGAAPVPPETKKKPPA